MTREGNGDKRAVKVLVTGDVGAGKTQFIRTISEVDIVATDKAVTDETRAWKDATTVAMDFGRITIDDDLVLYLFGTPGQLRFDFMWEILSYGMLGYVVMVDATRPATCWATRRILDFFEAVGDVPYVVVANKQDLPGALPPGDIGYILALDEATCREVIPCSACDKDDVKRVLISLFDKIAARAAAGEEPIS